MNLKKSLLAFAAVTALGVSMASAATIGVVNVNTVAERMPAFPAYQQGLKALEAKYGPQLQVADKELKEAKTEAAKEAVKKKYAPVIQKLQEEEIKLTQPLLQQVRDAIVRLEKEKKYEAILPLDILQPGDTVVDATSQVK